MFDESSDFAPRVTGVLQRTAVCHGAMERLARSTWELEAGLLRSAHAMLLARLTSYSLAVVGSSAYGREIESLGALGINISARRITGISHSARLGTLHMAAGSRSVQYRYLQRLAMRLVARILTARSHKWVLGAQEIGGRYRHEDAKAAPAGT